MAPDVPSFDELSEVLLVRLHDADATNDSKLHSFKELMRDLEDEIADQWYGQAFEHLELLRYLDAASHKEMGTDACGRLSALGRAYVRSLDASSDE